MKQHGWKIIAWFLVIFSIAGGLFIPLGPRIADFQVREKTDSLVTFQIKAVHTQFDQSTYIYLKTLAGIKAQPQEVVLQAVIDSVSPEILLGHFPNPKRFSNIHAASYLHLVVSSKQHGLLTLFDAFWIDSIQGNENYSTTEMVFQEANEKKMSFPNRVILNETIRNLIFHVPMWFSMIFILLCGFIAGIRYLITGNLQYDQYAFNAVRTGLFFGVLGILTGMLWANYTWGAPWTNDPKLNGAAIGMLVYTAYLILRSSVQDEIKKAKLSAVYSIFSFIIYIVFIFIMPRINDSLHPGNGGNPGFKQYDLDSTLRMFFYPAVIGWIMVGFIIHGMMMRYESLKKQLNEQNHA